MENIQCPHSVTSYSFTSLAWPQMSNSLNGLQNIASGQAGGEGGAQSVLCLQEYCHCFSTCSSLEWCGTCKRLMSIETFRHNANYRQTYTDISLINRQATCTLQAHYRWQILLQLHHWMIL